MKYETRYQKWYRLRVRKKKISYVISKRLSNTVKNIEGSIK